jgi:hypothetical protein
VVSRKNGATKTAVGIGILGLGGRFRPRRGGRRCRTRRRSRALSRGPDGVAALETVEPLDAGDAPLALGALVDGDDVVEPPDVLAEAAVDDRLRPAAEDVDVAGVVHLVDLVGARRAAADLAEDDLAVGFAVPLHVREPGLEAERREDLAPHRDARREERLFDLAQGDHLRADPLVGARHERSRTIPGDVLVRGDAVDRDGVEGVLLAVDELLDRHLLDVADGGDHVGQLVAVVHAVGVGGAGAGDRLDDQREADPLGGLPDRRRALGRQVARRADSGGVEHLLHPLLVAERNRVLDVEPAGAERLAQAGGEDHPGLPEALDPVDRPATRPRPDRREHRLLVPERAHEQVPRERPAHQLGQRALGLIADAEDARADLGEAAYEVRHLARVPGGEEEDGLHGVGPRAEEGEVYRTAVGATPRAPGDRESGC